MKTIITAVILSMAAITVQAADITTKHIDGVKHIMFVGKIVEGDADKFEEALKANDDIEWVSFNSAGGLTHEGHDIENLMNEYLMSSRVEVGNKCMSSCAAIFIGGERLAVEGKLGFHSHNYDTYKGEGRIRVEKEDIRNLVNDSQSTSSRTMYYILRNGFSWDLHFDYTELGGEFLNFNSNDELKKYYIGEMSFSKQYKNGQTKEFYKFTSNNPNTGKVLKQGGKAHTVIPIRMYDILNRAQATYKKTTAYTSYTVGNTVGLYTFITNGNRGGWVLTSFLIGE